MLPNFVVKFLSEDSSIRFYSSAEVNSFGALILNGSWIHANFSRSSGKYFSNQSLSCVTCSSKTDLSLWVKSTSLVVTNCCSRGKESLPPSALLLFGCYNHCI
jgi:hypothetical protein